MKTTEIKCDGCGGDLTSTGNMVDYRLALNVESKPLRGNFATAMSISPPLERDHHFCGVQCLDHWRDRERLYVKQMQERIDAYIDTHGKRTEFGHSYPTPSQEMRTAWSYEARAVADAAFPFAHGKTAEDA